MNLVFNGQPIAWPCESTQAHSLADFVQSQALTPPFACAVNAHFVAKTDWHKTLLQTDDRIEVVHAVTGG